MRKTVLHSSYIGKAASGVADGKAGPRYPFEKEEASILLGGVSRLFSLGVDAKKDCLAVGCPVVEGVDDPYRLGGVDVAVPCQLQLAQGVPAVVPVIHREQQPAILPKHRVSR